MTAKSHRAAPELSRCASAFARLPAAMRVIVTASALLILCPFVSEVPAEEEAYITGLRTYPLRENPQFSDPPMARIEVGGKVEILERKEGWVKVQYGETTGWLLASILGKNLPTVAEIKPLQNKLEEKEDARKRLEGEKRALQGEKKALQAEIEKLSQRVEELEQDLQKSIDAAQGAKDYQNLLGIALGGGLIIIGWFAGYALASASRRKSSRHKKYQID